MRSIRSFGLIGILGVAAGLTVSACAKKEAPAPAPVQIHRLRRNNASITTVMARNSAANSIVALRAWNHYRQGNAT